MLNQNNKTRLHRLETGRPKTRKTLIILGLFLSVVMISISGCSPRDGNSFLAQTRCAQLGDTTLASGSELLIVVNHIRARLGLPDFVGSWEFALDALYLGMCLDLMTSDAIAFIDRYERALVSSIDKNISNIRSLSVAIDPTVAPENAPSDAFEMLMNRDEPMDFQNHFVNGRWGGFARHTVCVTLYVTENGESSRTQEAIGHHERQSVYAQRTRRNWRAYFYEPGASRGMSLGACHEGGHIAAFAILFLLWSDNASAESDVIFLCCVVYPLLALGYATLEFVSSSNRFITNHRVVQSTTFFFPRQDLYADSVSGLEVRRSVVGTLFGYGTLKISAEGQTFNMPYVKDAKEVKLTWDKLAHQMQA